MNLNTESSFSLNPTNIDIPRSKFNRSAKVATTFNAADLIPIMVDEVTPGDTYKIRTGMVIRMSTPIYPVMDNAYLDLFTFFVPYRLVWKHWKEFMGENTTTKWKQTIEYEIPQVKAPTGGWQVGTIADYMGLPIGVENISVSALEMRAYALIVNEWFRDQNLQDPTYYDDGDAAIEGSNGSDYKLDLVKGGKPFKVAKYHDYFTSCLPEPQKGPQVMLPLGESAPVYGNGKPIEFYTEKNTDRGELGPTYLQNTTRIDQNFYNIRIAGPTSMGEFAPFLALSTKEQNSNPNIYTDLTQATASTINELRQAFALQKLYEKDARGGTRYTEIIKAHFGVTSPDARQQRPEFLGGEHVPIQMSQVLQTSASTENSPQGNTAAFSLTNDVSNEITKSFTEHGIIMTLACVRTNHTYQQGIPRRLSRKKRFDFYWPALANIGEQAVLNKEIYAQGNEEDEQAFGYQEAWAEYRYKPNQVTGMMRSTYAQSLDAWHYADKYSSLPILGEEWIKETPNNIDRTLAVQSSVSHQFIADFQFEIECVRPMPLYSIPGLIDHH